MYDDNDNYVDKYDNDDRDSSRGCTAHLLITLHYLSVPHL